MNGSCAGGTGAFIDQMASLLGVDPTEMNSLAEAHEKNLFNCFKMRSFCQVGYSALAQSGCKKERYCRKYFYRRCQSDRFGSFAGQKN